MQEDKEFSKTREEKHQINPFVNHTTKIPFFLQQNHFHSNGTSSNQRKQKTWPFSKPIKFIDSYSITTIKKHKTAFSSRIRKRGSESSNQRRLRKGKIPILIEVTLRPQALRINPILLAVTPFPSPLTTPPVTNTYFIFPTLFKLNSDETTQN